MAELKRTGPSGTSVDLLAWICPETVVHVWPEQPCRLDTDDRITHGACIAAGCRFTTERARSSQHMHDGKAGNYLPLLIVETCCCHGRGGFEQCSRFYPACARPFLGPVSARPVRQTWRTRLEICRAHARLPLPLPNLVLPQKPHAALAKHLFGRVPLPAPPPRPRVIEAHLHFTWTLAGRRQHVRPLVTVDFPQAL